MNPLDALRLEPTSSGYSIVLDGEPLGQIELDGERLLTFEIAPDQRRRGIGRRAMQLLLEGLPSATRLEVVVNHGDFAGRNFAEAAGFGIKGLVYDRPIKNSDETVELFRPVGQAELDLIEASGMKAFPPRLSDQPIFYPVATIEYARLIAKDWNVKDPISGFVGYVLRFHMLKDFLHRHPPREAGGRDLIEHWIPAEEMATVNSAIVGPIEIVETWR